MFAINHASAALLFKKKYPIMNMIWLLISVQLVEYFWVIFNYVGLESTTTEKTVAYIGDIHLAYMPFSHSLLTTIILSIAGFIVFSLILKNKKIAIVISLAIASHFVLDLLVHAKDLPLWYFTTYPMFGTNMYPSLPYLAFLFELIFGIFCWLYYRGSKMLLSVIVLFNLLNFTTFSPDTVGLEQYFAGQPMLLTSVIFLQIIITSFLVWYFSKKEISGAKFV